LGRVKGSAKSPVINTNNKVVTMSLDTFPIVLYSQESDLQTLTDMVFGLEQ